MAFTARSCHWPVNAPFSLAGFCSAPLSQANSTLFRRQALLSRPLKSWSRNLKTGATSRHTLNSLHHVKWSVTRAECTALSHVTLEVVKEGLYVPKKCLEGLPCRGTGSLASFRCGRFKRRQSRPLQALKNDQPEAKLIDSQEDISANFGEDDGKKALAEVAPGTAPASKSYTQRAKEIRESLPPEGLILMVACFVGLATGGAIVLFNDAVHLIHDVVWEGVPDIGAVWLRQRPLRDTWQQIVLVPVAGGVVVGILNQCRLLLDPSRWERDGAKSAWGQVRAGLRPVLKASAAAVTLGTGNSLGPEGPSVEIGASIAGGVGSVLKNSRERKNALVGAGSAAGIASGFNAAVAGTFFAIESVLRPSAQDGSPSLTTAMVLLASVLASIVSQAGLGSDPAFTVPAYEFKSPAELPLYLLLGLLCGGVSVALTRGSAIATAGFEGFRDATGLPSACMPPIGGLCVGVIALAYPEVLYWGFENVDVLLNTKISPWVQSPSPMMLMQLVGAKVVATTLSRGSGLVGGMYAPSLFIGAALGSAYGKLVPLVITWSDPVLHLGGLQLAAPPAYALVGMAATLAGVCQVPLTSVLLLFELTRDYRIILPLMGAVGLASWLASTATRKPIKKKPPPPASVALPEGDAEASPPSNPQNGALQSTGLAKPVVASGGPNLTRAPGTELKAPARRLSIQGAPQPPPIDSPGRRFMSRAKQLLEASEGMSSLENMTEVCLVDSSLCLTDMATLEERLLEEIEASAAMRPHFARVGVTATVGDAMRAMLKAREWCVLVVADCGTLEGMLTLADIQQEAQRLLLEGISTDVECLPVSALCTGRAHGDPQRALLTVRPDSTLRSALNMMTPRGLRQLPVCLDHSIDRGLNPDASPVLLGLLHREDIFLACRTEATKRVVEALDSRVASTGSDDSSKKGDASEPALPKRS